jgi:hypothetical protein
MIRHVVGFRFVESVTDVQLAEIVAYRDHPDHQRFIADHITGRVAERAAVQFEYTD